MIIFQHPAELSSHIQLLKNQGKRIGFFPTMGALHEGHISLLHSSKKTCDISVCSIFVNPTQFTNANDLALYPRTEQNDTLLLEASGCDILFLPNKEEIYANEKTMNIDFGALATRFEGASRPGHFEGVARVVRILFDIVQPDDAFFGLKDFQQCQIIKTLVRELAMPINLHFEVTKREADGLAMSSRNMRLTAEERKSASAIYQALLLAKHLLTTRSIPEIEKVCVARIEEEPCLKVDYFKIADGRTLNAMEHLSTEAEPVALAAVYAGEVRLIDNLLLK